LEPLFINEADDGSWQVLRCVSGGHATFGDAVAAVATRVGNRTKLTPVDIAAIDRQAGQPHPTEPEMDGPNEIIDWKTVAEMQAGDLNALAERCERMREALLLAKPIAAEWGCQPQTWRDLEAAIGRCEDMGDLDPPEGT